MTKYVEHLSHIQYGQRRDVENMGCNFFQNSPITLVNVYFDLVVFTRIAGTS